MTVASSSVVDRQRLGNAPSAGHWSSITLSLAKVLRQRSSGRDPVLTPSTKRPAVESAGEAVYLF